MLWKHVRPAPLRPNLPPPREASRIRTNETQEAQQSLPFPTGRRSSLALLPSQFPSQAARKAGNSRSPQPTGTKPSRPTHLLLSWRLLFHIVTDFIISRHIFRGQPHPKSCHFLFSIHVLVMKKLCLQIRLHTFLIQRMHDKNVISLNAFWKGRQKLT